MRCLAANGGDGGVKQDVEVALAPGPAPFLNGHVETGEDGADDRLGSYSSRGGAAGYASGEDRGEQLGPLRVLLRLSGAQRGSLGQQCSLRKCGTIVVSQRLQRLVQRAAHGLPGGLGSGTGVESCGDLLSNVAHRAKDHVLLGREVAKHAAARHAYRSGDLIDGGLLETLLSEKPQRRAGDLGFDGGSRHSAQAPRRGGRAVHDAHRSREFASNRQVCHLLTRMSYTDRMPKTIIITGASDGIGAAAARKLHSDGHRVVVVGRSPEKTRAVASEIGAPHHVADFADLADVRRLAADLEDAYPRIDVLANNAGGVFGDRNKTVDGFEKTFQINHLAPFLLTQLLLNTLLASRASVIQTSSVGARMGGNVVLDDLDNDRDFKPTRVYGTAKLENILFTKELHRRFHSEGISAAAFHPGNVATNFAKDSDAWIKHIANSRVLRTLLISPEKGAGQLVWLAEGTPGSDWDSGVYFEKYKPARRNNPQASDPDLAVGLWERSEQLLSTASAS